MSHVRGTEANKFHLDKPNGTYFESVRRRPSAHPRTAGWTVIKGKGRSRAGTRDQTPALLNARGFATILAGQLKRSQIDKRSFAVLILQVHRDEVRGGEMHSRLEEIIDGKGMRRATAARLGPNKVGVILRGADAKSAAAVSQELRLCLERLGFDSVEVDGGIFPDDLEMIRGIGRVVSR